MFHSAVPTPGTSSQGFVPCHHLQLSYTPLTCASELPPEGDEEGLAKWISAHVDW
jgi:hypothetical protein